MSSDKKIKKVAILPPDLVALAQVINSKKIERLREISLTGSIKIQFFNPVETLDVFFMTNWFLEMGLTHLNIDFFSYDPILLKNSAEGVFKMKDVENYCLPQNLKIEQPWLKQSEGEICFVDPRLLLKIQFHWIERMEDLPKGKHHIIVKGPVFSDSYEKVRTLSILPCYSVELVSVEQFD